ncbi:GNAT family N-acetyltransferase [Streptomyces sp. WMMB 322]|uniref:GNAT family N-acetyltransferase n=1 Tax=Streptomyces sp. WMMB 322 TaxID=1286821 RepID=UPI000823EA08|nr:GNAT family N-acetyltransferase [Streptomyces sp. WMMB 322]SCK53246.1 Protein N-acetyltransferase, RimJ/RimL family [Streptomyces sp. WMMB 322]
MRSTRTHDGGTAAVVHTRNDPALGRFALRPVDPAGDAELLHTWVTHPKSAFWLMREATLTDVEREFMGIAASEHHDAFLGLHEGEPRFLMERYDPAHVELKGHYDAQTGDVGMHFLCAPTDAPLRGFTLAVITTVMDMLFADPDTRRVVVEPDVRNTAVHALNEAVGFRIERTVAKPEKDAYLSMCTREEFEAAREALAARESGGTRETPGETKKR